MTDAIRKAFEAWVTAPPFEKSVARHSMDERKTCWPGAYRVYEVELAWEAWQDAWKAGRLDGRPEYYGDGFRAGWDSALETRE